MTIAFRSNVAASSLVLGLALGLQPLSIQFSASGLGSTPAHAKGGGEGNGGGGNGGGNGGGGEARGSDKGERGSGFADQGGKHEGKSRSVEFRGGAAAEGGNRGQSANVGILEGFLNDLRGEKKSGHSNTSNARSGEKSKTASTEKSGKVHEAKTRTTVTPAPTTAATTITTKVTSDLLGKLHAANASPRALERASANSTIGQLREYKEALTGETIDGKAVVSAEKLSEAAAILAGLANKEVTPEVVETLNEMLAISKMDDTQLAAIANKAESIKRGEVETDETAEAVAVTSP
jgi:hypothetical protein